MLWWLRFFQARSRIFKTTLFWCLLWIRPRLDKANARSFAFVNTLSHHSPTIFEGGGFQRVMGSQLLDEGAPGSLRFFGVWNCLLHLGHMFRRSAQAWKFCESRKCQDLKFFLDKKNGFKTLTLLWCSGWNWAARIAFAGYPPSPSRLHFALLPGAFTAPTDSWASILQSLGNC